MKLATLADGAASNFSRAAATYDAAAGVQIYVAGQLGASLNGLVSELPEGPVLEVGCGTGIMTGQLLKTCADRPLVVTDISESMVEQCERNLSDRYSVPANVRFETLDADKLRERNHYAAVVSSFSLQWFHDAEATLDRLFGSLVKGGFLFLSVPTDNSFPEWKQICKFVGTSFTGNSLPDASWLPLSAQRRNLKHGFQTEPVHSLHQSSLDFFRGLRKIGADMRLRNDGTAANLLAVMREWDRRNPDIVASTYEICYGWIKAESEEGA